MSLVSQLVSLLPAPPARLLVLGWPETLEEPKAAGREVHAAAESTGIGPDEGDFDAILWHVGESGEDVGAAIARLRGMLSEDGRVVVASPLAEDEPVATRRHGTLPSRHQERLRQTVRCLSEAGFAIHKDPELREPGEPRWKVLVAARDQIAIRPYADGDEDAIRRLFKACFHVERGLEHWRWKYAANPYRPPMISLAVSPADELVAHYSGYPYPFWCQDERGRRSFLALQMGDTMTEPSVRQAGRGKGGLLARTVRHFFSIHRDGTFGFFYGFNKGPIQRFCEWFIGGSRFGAVRYRVRDLEPAPGWSARNGYRVERIERTGAAWDRLFRRAAPGYRFLVRRDAAYLDWRYLRCPDTRYVVLAARRWGRLVGWSVFRRREDAIRWGDALFDRRHAGAAQAILATALTEPELAGAMRIEAWFPDNPSWWSERVASLGFVDRPEPEGLGMVALADAEPEAFERLGELYYTLGDGDLF